ncbi:MAG: type I DNA topoisomerase [Candidatus Pacebacteria bacterium CG_4_10_14_0_8_um_filter_43_12]|nr:MAG: type I DNA topoisomerase [Candidatus Pacebacteria bacterium CG_4_10_14_0_8_um_filter_43_12]
MNLVIVESPTKARKLKGYLDTGYKVEASVGHIRDLPKTSIGVDIEQDFKPTYEVSLDKIRVIAQLEKAARLAETIILATDPDREGEAIAWHIKHVLTQDTKKTKKFVRAKFYEITKSAVLEAIEHPTTINMDLVDAQQARRVVDRLVGYEVSPVLWKKIRRGLSAGRVQSVALRMIVEREREIEAFEPDEYWEVDVALSAKQLKAAKVFLEENKFNLPDQSFIARAIQLNQKKYEPTKKDDVTDVIGLFPHASYTIQEVEKKERKRSSLPPFTTSTLQQAAANRLGYSSKQTMRLAQQLYEEGLITYHRTDSVGLSSQAIEMVRKYIGKTYGDGYLPASPRVFANTSKNAQEAHEAIRVTHINLDSQAVPGEGPKLAAQHAKLYDLIWRRFVASQMPAAVYDQTSLTIKAQPARKTQIESVTLKATGSVLKFDGWMKLFTASDDILLPDLEKGVTVHYLDHNAAQKFTQPPPRYNDASLVKELEKKGIGRPSTYASIISVIEDRGYVNRDAKRFVATPVGMTVSDFLLKHFPDFMEYEFTAEMEEDLDRIARGEKEWPKVVDAFYRPFHKKVGLAEKADRAQIPVEKTGEKCPKCGDTEKGEVVIRSGRFGKFKSCSRYPECDFTENIVETVAGAKCPLCGEGEVIIRNSRWGKPFYGCGRYPECNWASWRQPKPGETITKTVWAEMQKKREERKKKREAAEAKLYPERAAAKLAAAEKAAAKKAVVKEKAAAKTTTVKKKLTKKKSPKNLSSKPHSTASQRDLAKR